MLQIAGVIPHPDSEPDKWFTFRAFYEFSKTGDPFLESDWKKYEAEMSALCKRTLS